jgi:hypothetical protein
MMKLSRTQAKEKLGCGNTTIEKFVEAKILTDLRPIKEGAQKHFAQFDSAEVNKLTRVYRYPMSIEAVIDALQHVKNGSNKIPVVVEKVLAKRKEEEPKANGIITRLDRIESLLDKLVKVWL